MRCDAHCTIKGFWYLAILEGLLTLSLLTNLPKLWHSPEHEHHIGIVQGKLSLTPKLIFASAIVNSVN